MFAGIQLSRNRFSMRAISFSIFVVFVACVDGYSESAANRLTYLDENDPYYVHRTFPKLTTPMWVGEKGVDAVIILSIDDMSDPVKYAKYLEPIFERLRKIDGRTPVSILTNKPDIHDPQLLEFVRQGVGIDVHTLSHPCPLFSTKGFAFARDDVLNCTTLLSRIPGNTPVAFRMPCCDSLNTPSPRFYDGIFDQTGTDGSFLTIDSSIFTIITPQDDALPRDWVLDKDGREKFRKYLPFPSFVNTIEDYHYPYVINRVGWEFPCTVPSDWEAQNINGKNSPRSLADMKTAVDVVVKKQGLYTLVFHPHGWIENTQVVDLIDHAVAQYGSRVKFLTFHEAQSRIDEHFLRGDPLRDALGRDNGVRLIDVNDDGYIDVLIGNDDVQIIRVWNPNRESWMDAPLPFRIVDSAGRDRGFRFGVDVGGVSGVIVYRGTETEQEAYRYDAASQTFGAEPDLVDALEKVNEHSSVLTQREGRDAGFRFRDIDGDGQSEILLSNESANAILYWKDGWQRRTNRFPAGVCIVDGEGRDRGLRFVDLDDDGDGDIVYANESESGVYVFESIKRGWSKSTLSKGITLPPIAIDGANNGAWFHSGKLWVVNETTSDLPDHADRRSFEMLLGN